MHQNDNKPCKEACGFGVCETQCVKQHGIIPVKSYSISELLDLDKIFLPHLYETCHTDVVPIVRPAWLQALWENAS